MYSKDSDRSHFILHQHHRNDLLVQQRINNLLQVELNTTKPIFARIQIVNSIGYHNIVLQNNLDSL